MSVKFVVKTKLPTPFATFTMYGFEDVQTGKEHVALTLGDVAGQVVLGRVHSECLTGDALFSLRCDCGPQLQAALERIAKEGQGVLLYLRQEGRDIGLLNKLKAYHLQDKGMDTVEANLELGFEADQRQYDMCVDMLKELKVIGLKLMTNNPKKEKALKSFGVNVVERVPLQVGLNPHNSHYLSTKVGKMGHQLDLPESSENVLPLEQTEKEGAANDKKKPDSQ